MQDYRVQLDAYHGPLDLLLYLIKRDEVDIHDIPIARITDQYLQHVQTLRSLDINLAGEFLVMAATLMEIKSVMMMPREPRDEGEEAEDAPADELTDPRYELVQQLLAYKRFRDAAVALDRRRERFAAQFPRRPATFKAEQAEQEQGPPELDMEDVSVWDLLEAFQSLMEQVGGPPRVEMVDDDTPLELHAADIVDRLRREGATTLQQMFQGRRFGEMIGLFLATLELLRQRKVSVRQEQPEAELRIHLRPETDWLDSEPAEGEEAHPAHDHDPNNPDNFDWPDDRMRRRYARRIERRQRGDRIEEDEELEEELQALEAEEAAAATPPQGD